MLMGKYGSPTCSNSFCWTGSLGVDWTGLSESAIALKSCGSSLIDKSSQRTLQVLLIRKYSKRRRQKHLVATGLLRVHSTCDLVNPSSAPTNKDGTPHKTKVFLFCYLVSLGNRALWLSPLNVRFFTALLYSCQLYIVCPISILNARGNTITPMATTRT